MELFISVSSSYLALYLKLKVIAALLKPELHLLNSIILLDSASVTASYIAVWELSTGRKPE